MYGVIYGEAFFLHFEIEAETPFQFQVPMICLLYKEVGFLFHCVSFLWISSLEAAYGFDRLGARHDGDPVLAAPDAATPATGRVLLPSGPGTRALAYCGFRGGWGNMPWLAKSIA